jgi:6-pyruvoyl-tetrahydropterin synthase
LADFDNEALNSVRYFQQNNPSAENVAGYIFEKLEPKLPDGVRLENVRVSEEPGCSAKFSKSINHAGASF